MMLQAEHDATEFLVGCIPLDTGETLRIDMPRRVLVYVAQGRVCISEDSSLDDVTLGESGYHRLARPGASLIEAESPTILLLTAPSEMNFAKAVRTLPRPPVARPRAPLAVEA